MPKPAAGRMRCFACKTFQVPISSDDGVLNCRECDVVLYNPGTGYDRRAAPAEPAPPPRTSGLVLLSVEDARVYIQTRLKMVGNQTATTAAAKAHKFGILYGLEEGMRALDALALSQKEK